MKATPIAALALLVLATTVIAQSPMRPGRWDSTMQMQMAGLPIQMPEMKTSQCITAEQLKDPASALPSGTPPGGRGANQDCKVSDYKVDGNTITWQVACTAPQRMTSTGEMVVNGDSYTGTMKMTTPQGDMTMKMAGTRVGDCTP